MIHLDTEKLIVAVKKYPSLWNNLQEDYHSKEPKVLAWEEVCKEMYKDWDEVDDNEKENRRFIVRKKWTNMRDSYRKDIIKERNNPNTKLKRKYIYADLMSFLVPVFNIRSSSLKGNVKDEMTFSDHDPLESSSSELMQEEEYEDISTNTITTSTITTEQENEHNDNVNKTVQTMKYNDAVNSRLMMKSEVSNRASNLAKKQKTYDQTDADSGDDDTKFLLSFRSDMKKMTRSQKIDFKIGMLQLVKKIYQEDTASHQSRYFSSVNPDSETLGVTV